MQSPKDRSDKKSEIVDLRIESMAFGGKGVARQSGKVYFVEGGIAGDLARVEIVESSERYDEARVVQVLEPSPHRGPSICPVSEICGGCQWQGVPYKQQLEWKTGFITNALRRIGKIAADINIEVLPSPRENGYRNRIFLRGRIAPDGQLSVGYFRRGSRDFVPISSCAIAVTRINQFLRDALSLSFSEECATERLCDEVKFRFEVQDIPQQADSAPHLLITVYDPDNTNFPTDVIVRKFLGISSVSWCGRSRDISQSPIVHFESHLQRKFFTSASVFQQINIDHNHTARALVKSTVEQLKPGRILDVFCGCGNLSLGLADGNRVIDGVEFSKRAIEVAKHNVNENQIAQLNYFAGDAEKFLWRTAKQGVKYDMVLVDPPREGMYKALIPLLKISPKHIIYISCDPSTLSRDLNSLCRNNYEIKRFVALDFFPNTYHIESFVLLEKKDARNKNCSQLNSSDSLCPRCGGTFTCLASNISSCPCTTVPLTPGQQETIRAKWTGCLCTACLRLLANPNHEV